MPPFIVIGIRLQEVLMGEEAEPWQRGASFEFVAVLSPQHNSSAAYQSWSSSSSFSPPPPPPSAASSSSSSCCKSDVTQDFFQKTRVKTSSDVKVKLKDCCTQQLTPTAILVLSAFEIYRHGQPCQAPR